MVTLQEELISVLRTQGLSVTQATVSRDIKELGLVKVSGKVKKYRYARPEDTRSDISGQVDRLRAVVLSCECAQNMVVIKTLAGNGNSIAVVVDGAKTEGVLGSIAGDDTIFIVTTDSFTAIAVRDTFREMFGV